MRSEPDCVSHKGSFFSRILGRKLTFRWVAPNNFKTFPDGLPVLLMNDGQDFSGMRLGNILHEAYKNDRLRPFFYVGIETNHHRTQDYGIASGADFKGRGGNAQNYSRCIIEEFIPYLKKEFSLSPFPGDWIFCGMSLGGLSAFDIVYSYPGYFSKAGVFSGSFWWRDKAYRKTDRADRSRMVLDLIKNGGVHPHLSFWFQCGTEDETADRNRNGIIDSIDDTLDVIKELQAKGYRYPGAITYVEIRGGEHNLPTWASAFPKFLTWAFGQPNYPG